MLLTLGHYHGGTQAARIPSSLMGWDQALQLDESSPLRPGCAAFPDQYVHLPNREIVILVSKVMIIFAPFHLFDAAAVSIPACGAIPLCRWGCNGECKAASSSLLIC